MFHASGTLEKLKSLAIFSNVYFPFTHLILCPVLNCPQTFLRHFANIVSLLHCQVDEHNCPVISPCSESLSFLVLSDNGIVCIVARQGKFIFIKCCINISFYLSQIFHQTVCFCGKLNFHMANLLRTLPPSAAN